MMSAGRGPRDPSGCVYNRRCKQKVTRCERDLGLNGVLNFCGSVWLIIRAMELYINLKVNFRGNTKSFLLSGSEIKSWECMEATVRRSRRKDYYYYYVSFIQTWLILLSIIFHYMSLYVECFVGWVKAFIRSLLEAYVVRPVKSRHRFCACATFSVLTLSHTPWLVHRGSWSGSLWVLKPPPSIQKRSGTHPNTHCPCHLLTSALDEGSNAGLHLKTQSCMFMNPLIRVVGGPGGSWDFQFFIDMDPDDAPS